MSKMPPHYNTTWSPFLSLNSSSDAAPPPAGSLQPPAPRRSRFTQQTATAPGFTPESSQSPPQQPLPETLPGEQQHLSEWNGFDELAQLESLPQLEQVHSSPHIYPQRHLLPSPSAQPHLPIMQPAIPAARLFSEPLPPTSMSYISGGASAAAAAVAQPAPSEALRAMRFPFPGMVEDLTMAGARHSPSLPTAGWSPASSIMCGSDELSQQQQQPPLPPQPPMTASAFWRLYGSSSAPAMPSDRFVEMPPRRRSDPPRPVPPLMDADLDVRDVVESCVSAAHASQPLVANEGRWVAHLDDGFSTALDTIHPAVLLPGSGGLLQPLLPPHQRLDSSAHRRHRYADDSGDEWVSVSPDSQRRAAAQAALRELQLMQQLRQQQQQQQQQQHTLASRKRASPDPSFSGDLEVKDSAVPRRSGEVAAGLRQRNSPGHGLRLAVRNQRLVWQTVTEPPAGEGDLCTGPLASEADAVPLSSSAGHAARSLAQLQRRPPVPYPFGDTSQLSHRDTEKQRRDRMNALIDELDALVPPVPTATDEARPTKRSKQAVLADTLHLVSHILRVAPQLTLSAMDQAPASGLNTGSRGSRSARSLDDKVGESLDVDSMAEQQGSVPPVPPRRSLRVALQGGSDISSSHAAKRSRERREVHSPPAALAATVPPRDPAAGEEQGSGSQ